MNNWDIANKLCLLSASRAYSLQYRQAGVAVLPPLEGREPGYGLVSISVMGVSSPGPASIVDVPLEGLDLRIQSPSRTTLQEVTTPVPRAENEAADTLAKKCQRTFSWNISISRPLRAPTVGL